MRSDSLPKKPLFRRIGLAASLLAALSMSATPVLAQGINILRDTETEEMLKSYEQPLARAAGLDPDAVKVYLVGDNDVNAFVAEGQNVFILSGIILYCKNANELIGVMAHETGHMKAGHLVRGQIGMQKAMIPMLLSMVVGLGAMIAGAGEAGMVLMGIGQAVAEAQFTQFTVIQESTADQIGAQLLNATHQSPIGMYNMFQRMASEEARRDIYYQASHYSVDHPTGQTRVAQLQDIVDASPYRDIKDSPQVTHTYEMVQAKLAGYVLPVQQALDRYPPSNTSEPARYARAMAYLRKPDLAKALAEIDSLIKDEPNNPYFYEVLGQIRLSMARPLEAIPAYQKSVDLRPTAPQLRLALATAQLATENPALAPAALQNLKAANLVENDDVFTWYETAQAYSMMKNEAMANLATAEVYYNGGAMAQALVFANRARRGLNQGTADWERANDIIGAAQAQAAQQRR
jgi:predicted Zn-dependent protease